MWREKSTRARAPLARKYTNEILVTRWHNKYKISNYIERQLLNFLNDLLTKSNRTTLQPYKVEEQAFGTPCIQKLS